MVAAVTTNVSQAYTLATVTAEATAYLSQAYVLAAGDLDSSSTVSVAQAHVRVATTSEITVSVSQAYVLVAVRMQSDNPNVRVWTFTLDGHDFYVLRLGTSETLVYDTLTGQWSVWGSGVTGLWKAYTGVNWDGGNRWAAGYGSNVIVGDDTNGSLYFLDPDGVADDDSYSGSDSRHSFEREVTAFDTLHGRAAVPVYGVLVNGSLGDLDDVDLTAVELLVSDDRGNNYVSCGTRQNVSGDYDNRLEWRSLGSMRNPGRIYKIRDYGALKRVDSIDVEGGDG